MMTTQLVNLKNDNNYDVYIGRGTIFGNPFIIGQDGNREEVIAKYEKWIREQPELIKQIKLDLKDKILACFCVPLACHGDVLIKIINKDCGDKND